MTKNAKAEVPMTGAQVEALMHPQMSSTLRGLKWMERSVTYDELARIMEARGWGKETGNQLKAKISRGKFSFVFFIRMMAVLNIEEVRLFDFVPPKTSKSHSYQMRIKSRPIDKTDK